MAIKHLKFETDEELIKKTPNTFKNCPTNDDNIQQMKYWLDILMEICKIKEMGKYEHKISEIERELGYNIPQTLHLIYSCF